MSILYRLLGIAAPATIDRIVDARLEALSPLPVMLLLVLALLGLGLAGLNFDTRLRLPRRTRVGLALLRILGTVLVLLMLVRLEIRLDVTRAVRPRVAVLVDTSGSMGIRDAGTRSRLEAARALVQGPLSALEAQADVTTYDFSDALQSTAPDAAAKGSTRFARALQALIEREPDLQAVVALTDGQDADGAAIHGAASLLSDYGVRAYPVVLGGTDAPPLAAVDVGQGAPFVRLGDRYVIRARLRSDKLGAQTVRVLLFEEGNETPVAARENVRLGETPVPVQFVVRPERAGRTMYRIKMEGIQGAAADSTQVADYPLNVLDAKIRVLYLDVPRDERKLLGIWLARDPVVDLATLTRLPAGGWYAQGALHHKQGPEGLPTVEADLYQYDVIILGDIPRSIFRQGGDMNETTLRWIVSFVNRRGGGLVTLGGRNAYAAGGYQDSPLSAILPFAVEAEREPQIPGRFVVLPTAMGYDHPLLRLAGGLEANRDAWAELPMLDGSNRVGAPRRGATLLATRTVTGPEGEKTAVPVMAVQNVGKGKVFALAADTTWRWQMLGPEEREEHYRRFWGNVVRYLAPDPRLRPDQPQIMHGGGVLPVGSTVTLSTRLVDKRFRPVRNADVRVRAVRPSGRETLFLPADGIQSPGLYEYDIELDEPGAWTIRTTYKEKTTEERLRVGGGEKEMDDPRARPDRLQALADSTRGRLFRPDETQALPAALHLEPRRVRQVVAAPLWNLPLTLGLLLAIIGLDCLIRKRRGMA